MIVYYLESPSSSVLGALQSLRRHILTLEAAELTENKNSECFACFYLLCSSCVLFEKRPILITGSTKLLKRLDTASSFRKKHKPILANNVDTSDAAPSRSDLSSSARFPSSFPVHFC